MGVVELVDPLCPNVVAAAIRAESGGVLGDTEVLSSLGALQTELTGAGILEPLLCADRTTDVLVTAPMQSGSTTETVCAANRFGSPTTRRFGPWRSVLRCARAGGSTRHNPGSPQLTGLGTGQFTVRLHAVLPPIAAGGTCLSLRVLRPASQDLDALTAPGAIAPRLPPFSTKSSVRVWLS